MRLLLVVALTVAALLVLTLVHYVLLRAGRRLSLAGQVATRTHRPAQFVVAVGAFLVGLSVFNPAGAWRDPVARVLGLVLIGGVAWLVTGVVFVVQDLALQRFRTDVEDNRRARTVHTQVQLVRRLTVAIVAVVAVGAMLLTMPAARAAGASVLASAGLVGVVAALAAQSLLGNVLAGLQLAYGKARRLDDVVIVEGEYGRVEEITLTYVVVQLWDERRMIIPTSWFTTQPFENWTRSSAQLLGGVNLDVDWTVPMERLRQRLTDVLDASSLWDRRVNVLQVTDAVGGVTRGRPRVWARPAPVLWDLRCHVREELATWLREQGGPGIPLVRTATLQTWPRQAAVNAYHG
jgi:small-conductance mechanosensitive channel